MEKHPARYSSRRNVVKHETSQFLSARSHNRVACLEVATCRVDLHAWVAIDCIDARRAGRTLVEQERLRRYGLMIVSVLRLATFEQDAANLFSDSCRSVTNTPRPPLPRPAIQRNGRRTRRPASTIDRIVHLAEVFALKRDSYRLRGRAAESLPVISTQHLADYKTTRWPMRPSHWVAS